MFLYSLLPSLRVNCLFDAVREVALYMRLKIYSVFFSLGTCLSFYIVDRVGGCRRSLISKCDTRPRSTGSASDESERKLSYALSLLQCRPSLR